MAEGGETIPGVGPPASKNVTQSSPTFLLAGFIHSKEVTESVDVAFLSFCRVVTVSMPRKATDDVTLLKSRARATNPAFQQRNIARIAHQAFQACCVQCLVAGPAESCAEMTVPICSTLGTACAPTLRASLSTMDRMASHWHLLGCGYMAALRSVSHNSVSMTNAIRRQMQVEALLNLMCAIRGRLVRK